MPTSLGRRRAGVTVLGIAVAVGLASVSAPASAAATPHKPAGVRVVSVGDSGFTVKLKKSKHAVKYRIWASTTKSRLALSTIKKTRGSRKSSKPRVTISGLPYTSAPYYYRVEAIGRGKTRYSNVRSTALRTSTPTALGVSSSAAGGLALTWSGKAAARYVVQAATDGGMTQNVRSWSTRSVAQSFTPLDLVPGTTYWFRVRAESGSSTSAWAAPVAAVARSRSMSVRVMSYNVLRRASDGMAYAGGERVAPWSDRGPAVVGTIRGSSAEVVGLQEASDWTDRAVDNPNPGVRQADWIRSQLGAGWSLASTETPPGQSGWQRTGRYVLYSNGRFVEERAGTWTLAGGSNPTFAAWAVLRERATGARMIAVSAHLVPQPGDANDRRRQGETEALLANANNLRNAVGGAQVVYLGDYNSDVDKKHPLDGPGVAMRAARVADADEAAQSVGGEAAFNTSNQLLRVAPASGTHVDHVWAPPGVGVRTWNMPMALRGGRFVGVIPSDHNAIQADVVLPW